MFQDRQWLRQGCIISHWLYDVYMDAMKKEVKMEERSEILGRGRECGFPGLLYAHDLVLRGESEKDLRAMVGGFVVEVCLERSLKVNTGKSKAKC